MNTGDKAKSQAVPASGDIDQQALFFHRYPRPGKLEIQPTKPLGNQRDLALAYSPGVAAPCLAIKDNPETAADFTARANLVAVVSNGTAVLGLGNIGPLASKPVMEGKAVLFKKFAGIDVFDIEIDAPTVDRMVDVISRWSRPSAHQSRGHQSSRMFRGGAASARENGNTGLPRRPARDRDHRRGRRPERPGTRRQGHCRGQDRGLRCRGGGACLPQPPRHAGRQAENIWVHDIEGLVYKGREALMDEWKAVYAQESDNRVLADSIGGADVFLGLSAAGVLKPELLARMAEKPLIMALANPTPEIMPEVARAARPDAMICTGRSDFPNQVNNVLCFPHIFRGALDCGARTINEEMKMAAVRAIAGLAREEPSDVAARAYSGETPVFGPDYLIPSPFDQRLILRIAPAVAKAAAESGVATRPIQDFDAYLDKLNRFVFRSGFIMKPVFAAAKNAAKNRVIFAEGEDERVLRAAQVLLEEARPSRS